MAGEPLRRGGGGRVGGEASSGRRGREKTGADRDDRRAGPPPSFAGGDCTSPRAGNRRIELRQGGKLVACRTIEVVKRPQDRPQARRAEGVYWKSTRAWDRATEGLFAAWVEALFDAPTGRSRCRFRPLAPALRDPKRNFLYDHLGLGEDDPKNKEVLRAEPDCADLPYFLRAYFAWKLGLPAGFRDCNRGTSTAPPRCGDLITNEAPAEGKSALGVMRTVPAQAGQHGALGQRPHRAGRRRDRSVPGPADARGAAAGHGLRRSRTATCWCW